MRRDSVRRLQKAIGVSRLYCGREAMSLKEIDKKLGLPRGTASHLLKFARRCGLLTVLEELPMPLNEDLGARLGKRFAPTRMLVTQTSDPLLAPGGRRGRAYEEDDLLHEMLGRAAAYYLSRRLRSLDLLATGAGRAVFHTARSLSTLPGEQARTRKVTVIPLHGRADRRVWRQTSRYAKQSIDTVRVIHALVHSLPMAISQPLYLPLVQESPEAVRGALAGPASFLTRREWHRRPPSLALVGLGLMGGPQAIGTPANGAPVVGPKPAATRPIRRQRQKLREICLRFHAEHQYIPIGDVCDRPFWVPAPEVSPELHRRARPLIRQINEHLLTVETGLPPEPRSASRSARGPRPASLDQVQEIVVVAGGRHKVRALRHLLGHRREGGRRFMDTLVTDEDTAEALLCLG